MIMNVGHIATKNFAATEVSTCNSQQNTSTELASCIINAASECTTFVRTIIKKSDSYDAMQIDKLKIDTLDKHDELNSQREHHKKFLQAIKANAFDKAMIEKPENPIPLSLIYSSIDSIKYNTGNCADMSLILGSTIAKYIPQRLTGIGFSKNNIFDARINTSLMYNSASGGNHVVVLLTFTDSKGISEYILDPWLDARIFKKEESYEIYKNNSNKYINENHCFEAYDKYSAIMNSAEYIEAIAKTINHLYGVNLDEIQLTNPFKFI
ncbi:hypothetical protein R3P88_001256 [Salmonella enterica]|nr:hypothetical protein [Salmonella enterica]ECC9261064.1 hypothetical protein [Salmonella enterica subsp. diarizonae]EAU6877648.1 hypothetical protein [Salmonella enterica]EAZ2267909.1 hypothetical protein [Salmonella enterica]EBI5825351.1 hypothetical protein [Salmonella enterica]